MEEMPAIADRIAAEHLELALDDAAAWACRIRHAGAIFFRALYARSHGDYVAGPNHVLPTARALGFHPALALSIL